MATESESTESMILRVAGPLFFLGMQMSVVGTAAGIAARQSVGMLPLLPFLSLFVNCVIWTLYGTMKGDLTVLVPNMCGVVSGLYCTSVYHKYSAGLNKSKEYTLSAGIIGLSLIFYALGASSAIALLGCALSVAVMGSPLSTLRTVLESSSTESMPFGTSLMAFLNSLSWSMYGLFISKDAFIYGPNLAGVFITSLQMLLFLRYGIQVTASPSSSGYGTVTRAEEGGGGAQAMQAMPMSVRAKQAVV